MVAPIKWARLPLGVGVRDLDLTLGNDPVPSQVYNLEPRGGMNIQRPSWLNNDVTSLPSPFTSRGISSELRAASGKRELHVVHYDGTNFDFWAHPVSDDGSPGVFGAWVSRDANVVVSSAYRPVNVAFAAGKSAGVDVLYYGNPGFASGRGRYQTSAGVAAQIGTDNTAGYAAAFNLERFWIGGAIDHPGYLKFTEIGDITNWNTSENFQPVGSDAVAIFDLAEYDGGLLIGKGDGIWWLAGKTLDTFQRVPVTTKFGVAPGRSMCESPYGVYCMGNDSHLYLYDGGNVRRVDNEYRMQNDYPQASAGAVVPTVFFSLSWVYDRLFIGRTGSTILDVYVPEKDAFYREIMPTGPSAEFFNLGLLHRYNDKYLMMMPGISTTNISAVTFRQQDGQASSRAQSGADDRDVVPENAMSSQSILTWRWYPYTPGKTTIREVFIRYIQFGQDAPATKATFRVRSDELADESRSWGAQPIPGRYLEHLQFGVTGRDFDFIDLRSSPAFDDEVGYGILEVMVGYLTDEDRR